MTENTLLDVRRIAKDCVSKIKNFPKDSVQSRDTIQDIVAAMGKEAKEK